MKQVCNVFLSPSYAVGDPRRSQNVGHLDSFIPSHGIFIVFSLIVRPEISWPGDKGMADHAREKVSILMDSGILNDEVVAQLAPDLWDSTFVDCRVQFESLKLATAAFDKAVYRTNSFTDIYLYQNGKIVVKSD